jgi:transposase
LIVAVEPPILEPSDSPQVAELKQQLYWAQLKIQVLEERLRLQRIQKYGPASEKLSDAQLELLEGEPGVSHLEVQAESEREPLPVRPPAKAKPERKHPGRQQLPADLPRVERVIACPPEQCQCQHCGQPTEVIGYEESEQLDVEPARYFVLVTKREKRACGGCEQGVATAPTPARIVEKGLVSDRVVIDTVISKYCDHRVPRTHRQRWRCGAVEEMRVGPSEPAIRSRLQTTAGCCRQKRWW